MAVHSRKRVSCPKSVTAPFPILLPTNQREKVIHSPSDSITTENNVMLRPSPRVELTQALKRGRYLEAMDLENHHLSLLLHRAFLFRKMAHGRCISPDALETPIVRVRKRRYIFKALTNMALLGYCTSLRLMNQRNSVVISMLSERYLHKRVPLPSSCSWLLEILPRSPDHIFEYHTRMTRRSFHLVLKTLQNEAAHFFRSDRGRKQLPLEIQLHLALFCLGYYGNGASFESARQKFGFGVGSIHAARRRVVNALVSLSSKFIRWPNAAERRNLCRRAREKYGYNSAFFLVDGTTHPFAFNPSYQKSSWFDREHRYSMQALVTCDAFLNVIHLVVGWPGSAHDARVLGSAEFMRLEDDDQYFTGEQHGLGDAAFGIHRRVVPNYKEPLSRLPENREYNQIHSSFRVRSEHTIGIVKNRFQGLKEIRMKLRSKREAQAIVKFITAGYVLHNMLQLFKDEWSSPYDIAEQLERDAMDLHAIENAPLPEDPEEIASGVAFREKVKHQVLEHIGYE